MSLSSIKGTGPGGSIVKADVEDYLGKKMNVVLFIVLYSLFMPFVNSLFLCM